MIIKPGIRVINSLNSPDNYGTIGGQVKDGKDLLWLTCFHDVFHKPPMDWEDTKPTETAEIKILADDGTFQTAGTITRMLRNSFVDVALIKPLSGIRVDPRLNDNGPSKGTVALQDADIGNTTLQKIGGFSGPTSGLYQGIKPQTSVPYPADKQVTFLLNNLLKIWGSGGEKFSGGGDSGSFVFDDQNRIAGMILMGDNQFTYAISSIYIETYFNVKFI
jgi:hypothetical protein